MVVPPPFKPFSPSPNATPQETGMAFVEWVADGIFRIHELNRATYGYTRAMYEHKVAQAKQGVGAPQQAPPAADILYSLGRVAVRTGFARRSQIGKFIAGLFKT